MLRILKRRIIILLFLLCPTTIEFKSQPFIFLLLTSDDPKWFWIYLSHLFKYFIFSKFWRTLLNFTILKKCKNQRCYSLVVPIFILFILFLREILIVLWGLMIESFKLYTHSFRYFSFEWFKILTYCNSWILNRWNDRVCSWTQKMSK